MRKLCPCLALLLASCVPIQSLGRSTLVVRPEYARTIQTTITPYTQADINHLTLKLFTTAEQDLGISKDLLNAQLGNAIAFSNLRNNTNYRIRAYAYVTAGTGSCISSAANSYTDVLVGTDDRPTLATLSVKLIDRDFNGQGTGSVAITPGGYLDPGASSMDYYTPQGVVMTLAGSGSVGFVNGTGTSAAFNSPVGVAVDATGNVYVADRSNYCIRKITPSGVATTLAGNGTAGTLDGTGLNARFNNPHGLSVDAAGNVYVAETEGHRIRKITSSGVVTTIAGNSGTAFSDGQGTAATFNGSYDIACDTNGNLYVADGYGHRIRKIDSTGMVTTLAGNGSAGSTDGKGTNATVNCPVGVAVDAYGNVFVAEYGSYRVRKITPAGDVSTVAGNGTPVSVDGQGTAASVMPWGITVDKWGYLYLADRNNNRIRRISPSGMVTTLAGSGGVGTTNGTGIQASFNCPLGIAADTFGNLYVGDYGNHMIRKIQ